MSGEDPVGCVAVRGGLGYEFLTEEEEAGYLPKRLPSSWTRVAAPGPSWICRQVGHTAHDLAVLMSVGIETDGRRWAHVSVSHPRRRPTWDDLQLVKELFLGEERIAYQVHPPRAQHYTLRGPGRAGNVLHLWSPLDGDSPLPDFLAARGGTL